MVATAASSRPIFRRRLDIAGSSQETVLDRTETTRGATRLAYIEWVSGREYFYGF